MLMVCFNRSTPLRVWMANGQKQVCATCDTLAKRNRKGTSTTFFYIQANTSVSTDVSSSLLHPSSFQMLPLLPSDVRSSSPSTQCCPCYFFSSPRHCCLHLWSLSICTLVMLLVLNQWCKLSPSRPGPVNQQGLLNSTTSSCLEFTLS